MFLVFSSDGFDLEVYPEFSCTGKIPSCKANVSFCLDESSIKVILSVDGHKRG
jgi:hypothetical protein